MGLFDWLFGKPKAPVLRAVQVLKIEPTGVFSLEVVGESNYQRALERICGGKSSDSAEHAIEAYLTLEDDNPYDNKAVRVHTETEIVGYLSRASARKYRKWLAASAYPTITILCKGLIVGGWDRGGGDSGYFGVRIDLDIKEPIVIQ